MNFHKLRSVICKIILWNNYVDFNILPCSCKVPPFFLTKTIHIFDLPLEDLICSNWTHFL